MQRTLRYASAQFQPLHLTYKFQPRASREAQSDAATLIDKGIPAGDATYDLVATCQSFLDGGGYGNKCPSNGMKMPARPRNGVGICRRVVTDRIS